MTHLIGMIFGVIGLIINIFLLTFEETKIAKVFFFVLSLISLLGIILNVNNL